jgi:hypothetical protein
MLRRDFIKTGLISIGGIIAFGGILSADTVTDNESENFGGKRRMNLHGHRRSGCASRPKMSSAFEHGFSTSPFYR